VPSPWPPSQPKTSWDETSQPRSRPSITSGVETSRLHTSRAIATQNFLGRDVPAPIPTLNYFGGGDVSSPDLPTPSPPKTFWDETSQPPSRPSMTSGVETGGDVSSPHLPRHRNPKLPGTRRPSPVPDPQLPRGRRRLVAVAAVATQNFLGRDVPAPIHTLNDFAARHQFETSPALPQPVSKTLKGFQTVAGGKAARPPPPVSCPQNSSPLRLRRGLGVVASQSSRKP